MTQHIKCLTCNKDITEPIQQNGDDKHPLCVSCWLAGLAWVYDDDGIMELLKRGFTLDEAKQDAVQKNIESLNKFAREFWMLDTQEEV